MPEGTLEERGVALASIGPSTAAMMDALEAQLDLMRERFPQKKHKPKSKLRLCTQALSTIVFGSLLNLLGGHLIIAMLPVLLNALCAVRVWCEETPRGRSFRKSLGLEEDVAHQSKGM